MKVLKTTLDGVLLIEPPTVFEDFRGQYVEIYNRTLYYEAGITQDFLQDDISVSNKSVLRGFHGDQRTWKLVSCLQGQLYAVILNWDPESPQYRQWQGFTISEANHLQILIPPKFGNSHLVMSERAIFHYRQTTSYDRAGQFTVKWNDPSLNVYWPISNPILSSRDACGE